MPLTPLETDRLILRGLELADAPSIFAYHGLEAVVQFCPFEPRSREEVDGRMQRWMAMDGSAESEGARYAMVLKTDGRVIGDFSVTFTDPAARQGELGYLSHPDIFGKGYVTEAARAVVAEGFQTFNLHRIFASCDARNTGSWRVMEKLGMRREALFRENEMFKGEMVSELVYGILEDEWRAQQAEQL